MSNANTTTIYTARAVITMDPTLPRAEALAIRDGRIVGVGALDEVIARTRGPQVVDTSFADKILLPGLIDQHLHPVLAATTLTTEVIAPERWVMPHRTFEAAENGDDYRRRLKEAHERTPAGEFLFSWGYHRLWHGDLHRDEIDAICGERPTAIWQRTCHEWHLNTAALNELEVTKETFQGRGFMSEQLDFDKGHFWENGAMALLGPKIMPRFATAERYREGLVQMIEYLHMNGVTGINEPGIAWAFEPWEIYQELLGDENVPFMSTFLVDGRTQSAKGMAPEKMLPDALRQVEKGRGTDKVHVVPGQVKLFCDGAGISQLMQMVDGYLDAQGNPNPEHHGEWLMEPGALQEVFDVYWDAGWQIHIHVNGDLGVAVLLDVLEEAQARYPRTDHRTVFVHFMNSTVEQVERIAKLGAIVSINPFYPIGFADKFSEVGLGPERAEVMSRAGTVIKNEIPLSFHSDLPMCPSDPLAMAGWGAGRLTLSGRVVAPDERISIDEALRAVTIGAAYSWRREHDLGSLSVGKIANVTVVDDDPYEMDPTDLGRNRIRGSIFQGRWFPVAEALVERRVEHAPTAHSSGHADCGGAAGHICGCEVAQYMARHMTRKGWAA